jgi:hypothetical protein
MIRVKGLAVAGLMVVAAACGGSDGGPGVASLGATTATTASAAAGAETEEVDAEEAVSAFAECLRDEGLDIEDPTFDGEGRFGFNLGGAFRGGPGNEDGPDEEFQAAFEECDGLLEGIAQNFERPDPGEIEDSLVAFADCMRGEGVDMADPDFSAQDEGPGGARLLFGDLDLDDPTVAVAFETCQSELAFGRLGGGPGGGGNNGGGA